MLADQSGSNVILANYATKEAKTKVTAQLTGVPLDTAIVILADMADLKLVRLGNVYYVTSREVPAHWRRKNKSGAIGEEPAKPPVNKPNAKK